MDVTVVIVLQGTEDMRNINKEVQGVLCTSAQGCTKVHKGAQKCTRYTQTCDKGRVCSNEMCSKPVHSCQYNSIINDYLIT